MGYIDLIPDVFRLTMPDLATGKSYHTQKFNVGNKQCIGVTIKASQALSVAVAYGIATDTAAAAGVDIAASLPYKTSATSFASNTSTEGGTYHEIAVPPHARQAQLVISNASGSTVSGAVIDAALRVVAYPDMPPYYGGLYTRADLAQSLTDGAYNAIEWTAGTYSSGMGAPGASVTTGRVGYYDYQYSLYLTRATYAAARELAYRMEINGALTDVAIYDVSWANQFLVGVRGSGVIKITNASHPVALQLYVGGADTWSIIQSAYNWLQLSWRCPL